MDFLRPPSKDCIMTPELELNTGPPEVRPGRRNPGAQNCQVATDAFSLPPPEDERKRYYPPYHDRLVSMLVVEFCRWLTTLTTTATPANQRNTLAGAWYVLDVTKHRLVRNQRERRGLWRSKTPRRTHAYFYRSGKRGAVRLVATLERSKRVKALSFGAVEHQCATALEPADYKEFFAFVTGAVAKLSNETDMPGAASIPNPDGSRGYIWLLRPGRESVKTNKPERKTRPFPSLAHDLRVSVRLDRVNERLLSLSQLTNK